MSKARKQTSARSLKRGNTIALPTGINGEMILFRKNHSSKIGKNPNGKKRVERWVQA